MSKSTNNNNFPSLDWVRIYKTKEQGDISIFIDTTQKYFKVSEYFKNKPCDTIIFDENGKLVYVSETVTVFEIAQLVKFFEKNVIDTNLNYFELLNAK